MCSSVHHSNFEQDVGKRRIFRLMLLVLINYVNFQGGIVIYGLCDSLVCVGRAVKLDGLLQKRKQTCLINTQSKELNFVERTLLLKRSVCIPSELLEGPILFLLLEVIQTTSVRV